MKGVAKLAPGPGHVAYAERPEVSAGPGEVVIELLAAGICGTDLHIEAG
jgi:threonine dehydrogenase-like Zn-dependent dehydrogenase